MIYPPNISVFVDDNKSQIVTNFASVIFNNQVKALKYDYHIYTFITVVLASIFQHNEALKVIIIEANIITDTLL